jgi:hypothetical protein
VNPDEWARARDVFDAAAARGRRERASFLDEACAGDAALRAEVESLLAAHDRSADFIERPVFEAAADLLADEDGESLEGLVIGPYLVRQEIGRGGMGVVYLADDTRLSRRVALKALTPGLAADPRRRERLRREARAAAMLSHPNIATVYALEEIGDELYLACEHVPGPTLRALIASGPVPVTQVVDIAIQLARAIAAAHEQGVVHRDLKPENVVRTAAGTVKVLDFGIARTENSSGSSLIEADDAVGTPGYMAPEQIRGQRVDFRADQFAFGVLVYEIACGANPFEAGTRTASIARVLDVIPAPLSNVCRADLPSLDRIVAICLSKDPAGRYASTRELVADVERLQAEIWPERLKGRAQAGAPASNARWWWQFHQAAVSVVYVLTLYPAWRVRSWLPQPWGTIFLLATLACAATSTTLRLHLWFTSRLFPTRLTTEHQRTRVWVRWCDAGLTTALLAATSSIALEHQAIAMLFVTVAISAALASYIIEPATTRAALDS